MSDADTGAIPIGSYPSCRINKDSNRHEISHVASEYEYVSCKYDNLLMGSIPSPFRDLMMFWCDVFGGIRLWSVDAMGNVDDYNTQRVLVTRRASGKNMQI